LQILLHADQKENELGIIGSILRRRDSAGGFRTVDGGHPAPYPDMTDEQLYNYEIAFKVPHRTFDRPPVSAAPQPEKEAAEPPHHETETPTIKRTTTEKVLHSTRFNARRARAESRNVHRAEPQVETQAEMDVDTDAAPQPDHSSAAFGTLDLSRPVRLITTKQPVEIITTRARHPVYKVHGYIGDADIATVFTLDGRLSENGPCFLENVPEQHELYLNIYLSDDPARGDRYRITQHASMEQAEASAADRIASVAVQFDL
jgi:hypothetical protein